MKTQQSHIDDVGYRSSTQPTRFQTNCRVGNAHPTITLVNLEKIGLNVRSEPGKIAKALFKF